MLADPDTPLSSRIGISAVFEHFAGDPQLITHIEYICTLLDHENLSIIIDFIYILGLSQNKDAIHCIKRFENHSFSDIKEAVTDALEQIHFYI